VEILESLKSLVMSKKVGIFARGGVRGTQVMIYHNRNNIKMPSVNSEFMEEI
jgi:hypothetical protein